MNILGEILSSIIGFLRKWSMLIWTILITFIVTKSYISDVQQSARYRTIKIVPAIVQVMLSPTQSIGTGFRFTYNGQTFIGTAAHVCHSIIANGGQPSISDGKNTEQTKILIYGQDVDACILVNTIPGRSLNLGHGQVVFSDIVYTFGFSSVLGFTYGSGVVNTYFNEVWPSSIFDSSDLDTCLRNSRLIFTDKKGVSVCMHKSLFFATNIPVYPGQSGSPLLNSDHEVVGILSMTIINGSLWVPISNFKTLVEAVSL